jgi:ferrous iron transport protein B
MESTLTRPSPTSAAGTASGAAAKKIVLVGNPNVGKSVFFGFLTGVYAEVSNYPGTTVEVSRACVGGREYLDTPGVYGVSSFNDEERVARDIILGADEILNIVDATHLERDLFLTRQLIDLGKPVVVALNFMDEAEQAGLAIDVGLLRDLLGVEVIPTTAVKQAGLGRVKGALGLARCGNHDRDLLDRLRPLMEQGVPRSEALLILEGDPVVSDRFALSPGVEREGLYLLRRSTVNDIVTRAVKDGSGRSRLRDILGRAAVNPVSGVPIMALVLFAMYKVIGVWVAGDVVGLTEETIMQGIYEPWVRGLISGPVPAESIPGELLVGEFGLLTMTVTYLAGLLLPLVVGFYLFLSLLEDSGYLPRLATLVDRLMTFIGLNGRAVIPIILGFGCVQLGTITTRLLGTRREKTIAASILNFAIPCSAQIGVIAGMLAAVGGGLALVYLAVIFSVLAVVGTVLNRVIPGESSALLIDLPPLRLPRPVNVLRKTATRSWFFMKEAAPWFFLGSLIVAGLQLSGGLDLWQRGLAPLTEGWLRLPREAATAFVMGMVRRDFGAAGLTALSLSAVQVVVSLVVITLFVPCIASLMVLFKERGLREAAAIWVGSWAAAFLVGGLVAQVFTAVSS